MKTMVYFWNVFVAHQPKETDMISLGNLFSKTSIISALLKKNRENDVIKIIHFMNTL